MKLITTSWDDGHPLDSKLADLLAKYGLPATFYVPQANAEGPVMGEKDIRELAKGFEIGGHTLHHTRLAAGNETVLKQETVGCFQWLSHVLGEPPVSFCFPGGVYNGAAVQAVFAAGFRLARTTELFSTALPPANRVIATTLQAYPHSALTYAKHLTKRRRWPTLLRWLKAGSQTDLCKLTEQQLDAIATTGGCLHLWGHSWEIEKYGLWKSTEEIFKLIAARPGFTYIQNRGLAPCPQQRLPSPS